MLSAYLFIIATIHMAQCLPKYNNLFFMLAYALLAFVALIAERM